MESVSERRRLTRGEQGDRRRAPRQCPGRHLKAHPRTRPAPSLLLLLLHAAAPGGCDLSAFQLEAALRPRSVLARHSARRMGSSLDSSSPARAAPSAGPPRTKSSGSWQAARPSTLHRGSCCVCQGAGEPRCSCCQTRLARARRPERRDSPPSSSAAPLAGPEAARCACRRTTHVLYLWFGTVKKNRRF